MRLRERLARAVPHLATSDGPADRTSYARDLWPRHHVSVRDGDGSLAATQPGVIVWPESTEDVAKVVRFCAEEGIRVVPFGAGSGVCGGVLPDPEMVVLDVKRMRRWRSLDAKTPTLDVEAGAMGITLEDELQAKGFTVGHFPSSILCSTVGGWLAARGAGQCSGRYGKIEDMVAEIELVDGRGDVVRLHRRASGPDLVPLVIGSEGTLGVITSTVLRLHPNPTSRGMTAYSFPTTEAGWTCLRDLFQAGLRPAVSRLYDPFDSFMAKQGGVKKRGEKAKKHGPPSRVLSTVLRAPRFLNGVVDAIGSRAFGGAMLILIYEGTAEENAEDLARTARIAELHGGRPHGDGPAKKWLQHRYSVSYRQAPVFRQGAFSDTMEVAAPWSRLGALYDGVRRAIGTRGFVMAHLSHAYPDGCSIYFTFAGAGRDEADTLAKYDGLWRDAMVACLEAGGTLSHHHGVGRSKAPRVPSELGAGITLLRRTMQAFDPRGILNPGALVGPTGEKLPGGRPPATPRGLFVDEASLTASLPGDADLADAHRALAAKGLALAAPETGTVRAWVDDGLAGSPDPWSDPVATRVAGLVAELATGETMDLAPSPRRAVGPDLTALFVGTQGRAGKVVSVTVPVARISAPPARALRYDGPREPPRTAAEDALLTRILAPS